jgi:hypothetical protein
MENQTLTEQELKLTAAIYTSRESIVEAVRETGKLPEIIEPGGFPTAMNVRLRTRGRNLTLSEKEQLVYDVILRERRVPGACVKLLPETPSNRPDEKE